MAADWPLGATVLLCTALRAVVCASVGLPSMIEPEGREHYDPSVPLPSGAIGYYTPTHSTQQLTNIFWSHIPKTSTTFARTVFSYACGPQSDDFVHTRSDSIPRPYPGSCSGRLSAEQDKITRSGRSISWYHMPVPWERTSDTSVIPSTTKQVVTLLRNPSARMRSEFLLQAGPDGFICCAPINIEDYLPGTSWGWDRLHRTPAILAAQGRQIHWANVVDASWHLQDAPANATLSTPRKRAQAYRQLLHNEDALYGCQTKMLLGYGCHEARILTPLDRELARRLVLSVTPGLAFVGFTERYAESVCLFHAMFGGTAYNFETDPDYTPSLATAGASRDLLEQQPGASDELTADDFHGGAADPDEEIYHLATQRFDEAIADNRDEVNRCLAQMANGHVEGRTIALG